MRYLLIYDIEGDTRVAELEASCPDDAPMKAIQYLVEWHGEEGLGMAPGKLPSEEDVGEVTIYGISSEQPVDLDGYRKRWRVEEVRKEMLRLEERERAEFERLKRKFEG